MDIKIKVRHKNNTELSNHRCLVNGHTKENYCPS